jgi:hypothetical protein
LIWHAFLNSLYLNQLEMVLSFGHKSVRGDDI